MPTVGATITVDLIAGQLPGYGARYIDVTRPGDATQRWWYEGLRGARQTLQFRRYFALQADAVAWSNTVTALQGREIQISDRLNARSIYGFLHAVTYEALKRIEASNGKNWAVIGTLDVQRTA